MATDTYRAVIELDATGMKRSAGQAGDALTSIELKLDRAEGSMSRTSNASRTLARFIGPAALGAAIGATIRSVIGIGAEFQALRVQLETVTGSAMAAGQSFGFIKKFAADTPFQVKNITDAFVGLKARGFNPTAKSMKALGDLGAAFGKDITTSMQAVTQAAFGEGEMLKQFGIIMKQQGDKVSLQYKGVTRNVKKDSQEIFGALIEMAQESDGAMERMSQTLTGRLSTMKDAFANFADTISSGGAIDALGEFVKLVTDVVNSGDMETLAAQIGELSAALMGLGDSKKAQDGVLRFVRELTGFLKSLEHPLDSFKQDALRIAEILEMLPLGPGESPIKAWIENLREFGSSIRVTRTEGFDPLAVSSELLAESLDENIAAMGALAPAVDVVSGAMTKLEKKIALGRNELKLLRSEVKVSREWFMALAEQVDRAGASVSALGTLEASFTSILPDVAADLEEWEKSIVDATRNSLDEWSKTALEKWLEAASEIDKLLMDTLAAAVDILINIDIKDPEKMKAAFGELGRDMGGEFGAIVGAQFGPIGEIFGRKAGEWIGEGFGKAAGAWTAKLANLISGSSGRDLIGSFAAGPGGFFGAGGHPVATAAMDQIKAVFDAIDAALGGTLELTQNMLVEVRKNGEAVLKIIETSTGRVITTEVFTSVEQAMNEGMVKLLGGALVTAEGPFADAFKELLRKVLGSGAELDIPGLVEAFESLAKIATTMESLGGPVDAVVASIKGQVAAYDRVRAEIDALNLSTEVTAGLIADLDQKFQNFQAAAELGVLSQMADMAEQFGIQAEFVKEIRIAEVELQFAILRATLEAHGIWKENRKLFRQLHRLALRAANAIGEVADEAARASRRGTSDPSSAGPTDVFVKNADDIGDAVSKAETAARLKEVRRRRAIARQPFLDTIARGGRPLTEFERIIAEAEKGFEQLRSLGTSIGLVNAALFIQAKILEALNPKIESAFDSLENFRRGLDRSAFAPGTNADKANDALADFLALLSAAEGGDLTALEGLPAAAQLALDLAAQAFGTSTDAFEAIFNQITIGLDRVLGNQDSITVDIQQKQLDAALQGTIYAGLAVQHQAASESLLREIRDAINNGALSQAAAV